MSHCVNSAASLSDRSHSSALVRFVQMMFEAILAARNVAAVQYWWAGESLMVIREKHRWHLTCPRFYISRRGHGKPCPPRGIQLRGLTRRLAGVSPYAAADAGLTDIGPTMLQAAGQHPQFVRCHVRLGVIQVMLGVVEPCAHQAELVSRERHGLRHAAGGRRLVAGSLVQMTLL